MDSESFFNFGDVIRLKKDLENTNLKTGDYGIVWAIYEYWVNEDKTALGFDYEGTFWDREGNDDDSMFDQEDAEKVLNLEAAPFAEVMKNLLRYLNGKENYKN